MNAGGIAYLSWKYLSYRPLRTLTLVTAVALTIYLPLAFQVFTSESTRILQERARSTPLLVGPKGSSIDLVLNSLYFQPQALPPLELAAYQALAKKDYGLTIPLHVRFSAGGAPVVGTTLDYFPARRLTVVDGRMLTRLGDCVIGARLAEEKSLKPGDKITSDSDATFGIDGRYPLRMRITGVLAPNHTRDDDAVFVDLKTAWIIEGLAHGHQDLAAPDSDGLVRERDGDVLRATRKVFEFNEVTEDNIASFHFHGDSAHYPITAAILIPGSKKYPPEQGFSYARDDYGRGDATEQAVIPIEAVTNLTETLFATRRMVIAAFLLLGVAALALAALVFLLSFRLREREMRTYARIGAGDSTILLLKSTEVAFVLLSGIVVALGSVLLTRSLAADLLPQLLN